jgi:adenylate cyclase
MSAAVQFFDTDKVTDGLRRILASGEFDASDRNRRFLRFIVEEALAGRADRVKAYTIATSVFGRSADFDPQLDSIVRLEAGRLRRALERYYLTAGQADPVRITIPRGGYVPVFVSGSAGAAAPAEPGRTERSRRGCVLLVTPFEEEGDQSAFPNLTRGLTRQVIAGLTRFTGLFVFGAETVQHHAGSSKDPLEPLETDLLLTGGTTMTADHFTLEVLLSDARTGRYVWGETFERSLNPGEIIRVRDEVANKVVRSLAQPRAALRRDLQRTGPRYRREAAGEPVLL